MMVTAMAQELVSPTRGQRSNPVGDGRRADTIASDMDGTTSFASDTTRYSNARESQVNEGDTQGWLAG